MDCMSRGRKCVLSAKGSIGEFLLNGDQVVGEEGRHDGSLFELSGRWGRRGRNKCGEG